MDRKIYKCLQANFKRLSIFLGILIILGLNYVAQNVCKFCEISISFWTFYELWKMIFPFSLQVGSSLKDAAAYTFLFRGSSCRIPVSCKYLTEFNCKICIYKWVKKIFFNYVIWQVSEASYSIRSKWASLIICTIGCGDSFLKIPFWRAFDSPGPGDLKTVFFFFWVVHFSNNLTSKFGIP